jgi:hypothetical protein
MVLLPGAIWKVLLPATLAEYCAAFRKLEPALPLASMIFSDSRLLTVLPASGV